MASDSFDALMHVSTCNSDENLRGTHILDLPLALLSRILSQVLDPVAAAYIICSCRTFRALSKSIPFSFKVSCTKLEHKVEIEERVQKKHSLTAIRTWTRRLLSSVRNQMPMTKVLDLSGCWILDEDIAAVLADLRCLKCLILDGCQKLEQVGQGVTIWDFCERESVCSALTYLNNQDISERLFHGNTISSSFEGSKAPQNFRGFAAKKDYVSLALRAAVNCSDLRRRTPLHVAANEADTEMVRGLLTMGASLRLKDSTGATALFDAAWNGHNEICQLLLMSGADVLTRNRSGENSLYAAALKGHTSVVRLFVSHCQANNINWQSSEVYGDGWTPLMAAAVADRQDVAKVLLEAAGLQMSYGCLTKECMLCKKMNIGLGVEASTEEKRNIKHKDENVCAKVPCSQILDAQNRYGQTALHIAARRGSGWFVSYLLHAGASLNIEDEYKKRPADLAQKQKHTVVANFLKQWELQLKQPKLDGELNEVSGRGHLEINRSLTLAQTNCESLTVRGSSKNGLKASSLKQVWRAKGRRTVS